MRVRAVGLSIARVLMVSGSVLITMPIFAAGPVATQADRGFVAKVSQGGAYEVEAGRVAAARGLTPVIKNFGVLKTHDHEGVGSELKRDCHNDRSDDRAGMNAEFTARLAKLKSVPAEQFEQAYVADMKQIHNKDEGLFCRRPKRVRRHTTALPGRLPCSSRRISVG